MVKIAFRNLWDHKLRSSLLAAAVVAGVSFVVASFVFTDSLGASFDDAFSDALESYDITVEANLVEDESNFGPPSSEIPSFDASVAGIVAAVDGVATASPSVATSAFIDLGEEGIGFGGPPTIAFSWTDGPSSWKLVEGRPPIASSEVVIFVGTATDHTISLGDTVRIAFDGPVDDFTVVGTMSFGDTTDLFGAEFIAFEYQTAKTLFGLKERITSIDVNIEEGFDVDKVVEQVNLVIPKEAIATSTQTALEERSADLKKGLSFFNTFLLAFAGIALVVGLFVVYNAFRVVVAQRSKELALLRILGTKRLQLIRGVLVEAGLIGIVASFVGILAGMGLALGIRKILELLGNSLPDAGLILAPRTILIGFVVGILATLISAVIPAVRTGRISPMAALRDMPSGRKTSLPGKLMAVSTLAASIGLIIFGAVQASDSRSAFAGETGPIQAVGFGGLLLFIGLYLAARFLARPIIGFLGLGAKKMTATLARENARRSPRRTATTAASLMIGLGLVVMVAILSVSIQDQILAQTEDSVAADIFIQPGGNDFLGKLPMGVLDIVKDIEGVETATGLSVKPATLPGDTKGFVLGVKPESMHTYLKFKVTQGSLDEMVGDSIAVQQIEVKAQGFQLGDVISINIDGEEYSFTLAVVFKLLGDTPDNESYYINQARMLDIDPETGINTVGVVLDPEIAPEDGKTAIETALADYPTVRVSTIADIIEQVKTLLDSLVAMIGGLLFMSVVIALIGIVLTLYLAVIERTREIGLLRAIGMSQKQIRRTIRFEAVLIALFGAVLGICLGVFLGWGLVRSIIGEGGSMTIPWIWLLAGFFGAGVSGILAAIIPSYQASNMDVLKAIGYE